jgi:hypothetical protein
MSLLGTFVLFSGVNDQNVRTFAVLYVLGNIIGNINFLIYILPCLIQKNKF